MYVLRHRASEPPSRSLGRRYTAFATARRVRKSLYVKKKSLFVLASLFVSAAHLNPGTWSVSPATSCVIRSTNGTAARAQSAARSSPCVLCNGPTSAPSRSNASPRMEPGSMCAATTPPEPPYGMTKVFSFFREEEAKRAFCRFSSSSLATLRKSAASALVTAASAAWLASYGASVAPAGGSTTCETTAKARDGRRFSSSVFFL